VTASLVAICLVSGAAGAVAVILLSGGFILLLWRAEKPREWCDRCGAPNWTAEHGCASCRGAA
jgi:hypothetical protein